MVWKLCTHSRFSLSVREALGDAVALGLAHEGRRGLDAEEGDLVLEVVGHAVGAVVVAKLQPGRRILSDSAEVLTHALPDWLPGPESSSRLAAWMPTHSLLQWSTATKTW